MAKAAYWTVTDVEARKRGEQTGLDTMRLAEQIQRQAEQTEKNRQPRTESR